MSRRLLVIPILVSGVLACDQGAPPAPDPATEAPLPTAKSDGPEGDLAASLEVEPAPLGPIALTPELHDALSALEPGVPVQSLAEVPGYGAMMKQLAVRAPAPGSPTALCKPTLYLPVEGQEACSKVPASALDAGSWDSGQGEGALKRWVDQTVLCGVRRHPVKLYVADADGNQSACHSDVVLCDHTQKGGCPGDVIGEGPQEPKEEPPTDDPGEVKPKKAIRCYWTEVPHHLNPDTVEGSEGKTKADLNGEGPSHYAGVKTPGAPDWSAGNTLRTSGPLDGELIMRTNVLCVDEDGEALTPGINPEVECTSRVWVEGFYRSELYVTSSVSSLWHFWYVPAVETYAQDEAELSINDTAVFDKAVTLQNGNDVSITVEYGLEGGLEASAEGVGANVGVSFGRSITIHNETGSEDDELNAFGTAQEDVPVTIRLASQGRAKVRSESKATGRARAWTRTWTVAWVGKSSCPGAGNTWDWAWGTALDPGPTMHDDIDALQGFLDNHGIDATLPHPW